MYTQSQMLQKNSTSTIQRHVKRGRTILPALDNKDHMNHKALRSMFDSGPLDKMIKINLAAKAKAQKLIKRISGSPTSSVEPDSDFES